jgi:hypothetical protein
MVVRLFNIYTLVCDLCVLVFIVMNATTRNIYELTVLLCVTSIIYTHWYRPLRFRMIDYMILIIGNLYLNVDWSRERSILNQAGLCLVGFFVCCTNSCLLWLISLVFEYHVLSVCWLATWSNQSTHTVIVLILLLMISNMSDIKFKLNDDNHFMKPLYMWNNTKKGYTTISCQYIGDPLCGICLQEMIGSQSKMNLCTHVYHTACITPQYQVNPICPQCRA